MTVFPKIYPKRLHVEFTSCCNYRCVICAHRYDSFRGEFITDKVKDVLVRELIPHASQIEMQGTGETLLYNGLKDIIDAARKYSCELILITNASLLDQDKMVMLAAAGCHIIVSLDSPVASTYEKIRVNGNFARVYRNVEYWKFIKRSLPNDNKACLGMNMVLCSLNYLELVKMVDFAVENEAKYLFVSEVRQCSLDNASWKELTLEGIKETEEFQRILQEAQAKAKEKNFDLTFNFRTNLERKHARNICVSPWEHIYIAASGDVSVCCEFPEIFGNLNETDFYSIWNGEKLNAFRASMAVGDYCEKCQSCCLPWGITHDGF